jgi:parallel beta-helix repeat protein
VRRFAPFALLLVAVLVSGCATGFTGGAASVSGTKARLSGNVASNVGGPVEYWFQYGPTTGYGSESTHQTTSSTQANQPKPVVADIAGLALSSTYHFRLCAQDSQQQGGPGCGEDGTFTTTNLACGDVITTDFVLSGTTTCESDLVGLVIGADGVDVNLNGHSLNGPTGPVPDETTGVGVDNGAGHDDVTIRNGGVRRWGKAVHLTGASFNVIRNVDLRQGASHRSGVRIEGGESNTIRSAQITGLPGLFASGSDALVVADSVGYGWQVSGIGTRLVRNGIGSGGAFTPCLILSGNRNRAADNSLDGCSGGGIFLESGGENELVGNEVHGGLSTGFPEVDGIRIQPFTAGTLLQGNYAHGFQDDGIDVRAAATRLVGNRADSNGDFGIDAVAGVTDGGGNTASGNGNPLQCRNVFCAPSP